MSQLLPLLIGPLIGMGQGLTAPHPNSFGSPEEFSMLHEAQGYDRNAIQAVMKQLSQGVTLPDAVVQNPPTFFGGDLPMPIGVSADVGGLAKPFSLPGLNFPDMFHGPSSPPAADRPGGVDGPNASASPGTGGKDGADTPNHRVSVGGPARQSYSGNDVVGAEGDNGDSGGNYGSGGQYGPQYPTPTHAALDLLMHAAGAS